MTNKPVNEDTSQQLTPFEALAFDDEMLIVLSRDTEDDVHLHQISSVPGICYDVLGVPHNKASVYIEDRNIVPAHSKAVIEDYTEFYSHGLYTGQMTLVNGRDNKWLLSVGDVSAQLEQLVFPEGQQQPSAYGAKIPLSRLKITFSADGEHMQVELVSDLVLAARQSPMHVLIGTDDRIVLILNNPENAGHLTIVDTNIPGASECHTAYVMGLPAVEIPVERRACKQYISGAPFLGNELTDCGWFVDSTRHELNGINKPVAAYSIGFDSCSVLATSNPEWIIVAKDGGDYLIGFKSYFDMP